MPRRIAVLGLLFSLALLPALAADPPGRSLFEFRDTGTLLGEGESQMKTKPWKPEEKAHVQKLVSEIQQKAPGVIRRATAYRPILFFRPAEQIGREDAAAFYSLPPHALFLSDYLFIPSSGLTQRVGILLHELVHMADSGMTLTDSKAWIDLVRPMTERALANLDRQGVTVREASGKGLANLVTREGFPTLWASFTPAEALAEFTVALVMGGDTPVPAPIRSFIQTHLLSLSYTPQPALQQYHEAMGLLDHRELDAAIAKFDQAIRLDPTLGIAYAFRANVWKEKREVDRAIADYSEAIRLRPYRMNASAHKERAQLWRLKGEHEKAIADYTENLKTYPDEDKAYLGRGQAWFDKKEYAKAIADFTQALKYGPDDILSLGWRAQAHHLNGDPDAALPDLTRIIQLHPTGNPRAYVLRAQIWSQKKEYDKAITDYTQLIALNPREPLAYQARGEVWLQKQELDKALADFSEVIRLKPDHLQAYGNRGDIYFARKEYDKALADYEVIIMRVPGFGLAYYMRGRVRHAQAELAKAIGDYETALRLAPTLKEKVSPWLGKALEDAGRSER